MTSNPGLLGVRDGHQAVKIGEIFGEKGQSLVVKPHKGQITLIALMTNVLEHGRGTLYFNHHQLVTSSFISLQRSRLEERRSINKLCLFKDVLYIEFCISRWC
ncbi:hypothetical protein TcasGA2_TC015507 [Tribolium castaneum]|uniref:Uncharacterized protein n=1 Tax=Tribolium castaneum TaxID=7070 RepID=D2A5B7_TRICA|nr:hypothetical protein TcasGA2_TC015507 [Tribolium castaneum]